MSSSAIISSILRSVAFSTISVLLSSPYFSLISRSSSLIICILFVLLSKMPFNSAIYLIISLYSARIFSVSRPVSFWSFMSKIACACFSDNLKPPTRPAFAVSGSLLFLIVSRTLSMLSRAIFKPSKIWALASAFLKSNSVLLTTISCLKTRKTSSNSFKDITFGVPSIRANKIIPKVSWSCVCLYNWFKTTSGTASLLVSITILIPSLSVSSRSSAIPSIFLSLAKSAIFSIKLALFTWYGISVIIRESLPLLFGSTCAVPLILTFPLPVLYASLIPSIPKAFPAVGKSGPFMCFIKSSTPQSGLSIASIKPSITSVRLCGGIFVAIPTAIPSDPFTKRFGKTAGRTAGSFKVSSKLFVHATVSLSRSLNNSPPILDILDSVYLIAAALSPSTEPKFPCPWTSWCLIEKSCAILTIASYIELSPWGWYLPKTSPTTLADFLYGLFQ